MSSTRILFSDTEPIPFCDRPPASTSEPPRVAVLTSAPPPKASTTFQWPTLISPLPLLRPLPAILTTPPRSLAPELPWLRPLPPPPVPELVRANPGPNRPPERLRHRPPLKLRRAPPLSSSSTFRPPSARIESPVSFSTHPSSFPDFCLTLVVS